MSKVRRCLITGTHGSGKSTLSHRICSELKKKGYNAVVISETARECPFPINKGQTLESTLYIALKQAVKELEAIAHGYSYLVLDRGVLDSFMYSEATRGCPAEVLENAIMQALVEWTRQYDEILFVKGDRKSELQNDGVRDTDQDFAAKVEDLFEKMLFDHFADKVQVIEYQQMLVSKVQIGEKGEVLIRS